MPTETYTPAQAASMLNVHANTVRAWTREYGDVLSDSARGRPRLLTPRDVALLQLVAQLRADGLTPNAVLARLRNAPDADIQQPYIDVTLSTVAPTAPAGVPSTVDVSSLLREFTAIVDTRTAQHTDTVRQLDERLRQVESRRTLAVAVIVALCVGLVIGLLLALLLLSR